MPVRAPRRCSPRRSPRRERPGRACEANEVGHLHRGSSDWDTAVERSTRSCAGPVHAVPRRPAPWALWRIAADRRRVSEHAHEDRRSRSSKLAQGRASRDEITPITSFLEAHRDDDHRLVERAPCRGSSRLADPCSASWNEERPSVRARPSRVKPSPTLTRRSSRGSSRSRCRPRQRSRPGRRAPGRRRPGRRGRRRSPNSSARASATARTEGGPAIRAAARWATSSWSTQRCGRLPGLIDLGPHDLQLRAARSISDGRG